MTDGSVTTIGKIQAGSPMLINLWAYWCAPCRAELPAISAAGRTLGDKLTTVLVHSDPREQPGLELLKELDIHRIAVSDVEEKLAIALPAPPVLPLTYLVRSDGSIAAVHVDPLFTEQEVLGLIEEKLGVTP